MKTEFQRVQEDCKLTNDAAAILLQKSNRTITRYRSGEVSAPKLLIDAMSNSKVSK